MKGFRGFAVTLGVVLATMIFSSGIPAFADGSHSDPQTTASEAASANDQDTMEKFVLHAKQHIDDILGENRSALSTFYKDMRDPEGIWRHDPVYLIALRPDGTVVNHGKYTKSLFGASLAGFPTVANLLTSVQQDAQGGPVCEEYGGGWSCAVEYTNAFGDSNVLIGGFDHDEQDMNVSHYDCPDYVPDVTAQQVSESQSEEDLENFVKGAITRIRALFAGGVSGLRGDIRGNCLGREGPWNHGSIYLFIMTAGNPPIVFLNGNNPELTGAPFVNVLDEDEVNVGEIIIEAAGEHGKGGIVRYKWDNPVKDGDEINMPGRSPGNSPKISYVEGVQIGQSVWIFGSGIYPDAEEDDGGCAIAGTGSNLAGTAFNLFLIVFSLCLAFWWKDRSRK